MANTGIFPPDYGTDVGRVRLLIGDVDQESGEYNFFADTELAAYLEIYSSNIRLAAARALDTIADSQALIERKIRTDDLQTDGPAVANALRKSAQALRDEDYKNYLNENQADDIRFDDMPNDVYAVRARAEAAPTPWLF